jgi:sugar phosphate isomerase/epimerase
MRPSNDSSPAAALDTVGVQLYTVREALKEDFDGTLAAIAEMGYDAVEFAGYHDRSPHTVKALTDRLGLATPSVHVLPGHIRKRADDILAAAQIMEHEYVVCAFLQEDDRGSLAAYRDVAALLDDFGARCAKAGIQLAYHNHDFEFHPIDGTLPYDLLLDATDPAHVAMELDLYWIRAAGYDAADYVEAHPGRFPLWHLKDMDADGAMCAVGEGEMDMAAALALAETAGLQHAFVEHDDADDPMASIRSSLEYLRQEGASES